MSHTPGPWRHMTDPEVPDDFVVVTNTGHGLQTLVAEVERRAAEGGEADARLIAAAPDLLVALEGADLELAAAAVALDAAYHDDTSKGTRKALHNVRRAIAKATPTDRGGGVR